MARRILCVDPDEAVRDETAGEIKSALSDLDPIVETLGTLADAEAALEIDTAAIVTEYTLPDGTGFDLIRTAEDVCPDAGCVLYTDTDPDTIDTSELHESITEYVGKGSVFGAERLTRLLRTTIERRSQGSYPLPQNESERVATLRSYDLDDEGLVESLNRVTDLAARYFDVEQASINLITEHSQEFLACYGDSAEWDSMDREDSICTFTIVEDDSVMSVEDVTEDPRFESRSEALTSMGIRSYLGASLTTTAGLKIGSLCVYDDEPRSFSASEKAYLRDLAVLAIDLIELYEAVDASTRGETQ